MTTSTLPSYSATTRFAAIVDRQRTSRLRDLIFAAALAIGASLSLGALHSAAAHAAAPTVTIAAPVTTGV